MAQVKCPHCGKETLFNSSNSYRPFCSERCQMIDLGKWANEEYNIPGEETSPASEHDDEEDSQSPRSKPLLH